MLPVHPALLVAYVAILLLSSATAALTTRYFIRRFATETYRTRKFGWEVEVIEYEHRRFVGILGVLVFFLSVFVYANATFAILRYFDVV